jgi:hypothetical protein
MTVHENRVAAALERAHPHDAAWRELGLRSAMLWRLLGACLPVFFVAYALGAWLGQPWLYPVAALAWLAAIGWAGVRVAGFACPRCAGAFFETWYFFKPLRRSCAQCGFPRGAPTAAQP